MTNLDRIESMDNSKIKLAAKLSQGKHRRDENLFVAEGIRLVEMAAESDWPLEFALISDSCSANERAQSVVEKLLEKGCPVYQVPDKVYNKAADTVTPQGLLLVMGYRIYTWQEVLHSNSDDATLIAVLDHVQDPGNAGTIIRTADASGCTGVVCLEGTTDIFSGKAVRSSMGSLFNLPIITDVSPEDFVDICHANDVVVTATALDDQAIRPFMVDYVSPVAIVFGNEGNGISPQMLQAADKTVFIPMVGKAESLNVASAAAIMLYEALRQRSIL